MGCCRELSGLNRSCERGTGGIRRAWIACYDSVTDPTLTADMISSIGTPTSAWHLYEFRKQTGSFTTTLTTDAAAGSLYYSTAIVLQFSQMEAMKRTEIEAIAESDTRVIVEDNNGRYWYFGFDNYVELTDGTAETGTAFGDFNGYNITLEDISQKPPYEVSAAGMAPLLTGE